MSKWIALSLLLLLFSCTQKVQHNELRIGMRETVSSFNPVLGNRTESENFWRLLYQPLVDFDVRNMKAVPVLAKDLPVVTFHDSTNTFALRFEIKNEARWDNGLPVTARDVAFTLKLLKLFDTKGQYPLSDEVKEIVFTNDVRNFTMIIQADSNHNYSEQFDVPVMPEYFYDPKSLLFEKNFDEMKSFRTKMPNQELEQWKKNFLTTADAIPYSVCGSGAYHLVSVNNNASFLFERKPDWWGNAFNNAGDFLFFQAYPARINYVTHCAPTSIVKFIVANHLDVFVHLTKADFIELNDNKEWQKQFNLSDKMIYNNRLSGVVTSTYEPGYWEAALRTTLQ